MQYNCLEILCFLTSCTNFQESQASKIYAEQKEEEVKILEQSVEELESTINVLEKKVSFYEYDITHSRICCNLLLVFSIGERNGRGARETSHDKRFTGCGTPVTESKAIDC